LEAAAVSTIGRHLKSGDPSHKLDAMSFSSAQDGEEVFTDRSSLYVPYLPAL
jgi:hypothetical protein